MGLAMIVRSRATHWTAFVAVAALHACGTPTARGAEPAAVPREFRAAWIATVANIDWP